MNMKRRSESCDGQSRVSREFVQDEMSHRRQNLSCMDDLCKTQRYKTNEVSYERFIHIALFLRKTLGHSVSMKSLTILIN